MKAPGDRVLLAVAAFIAGCTPAAFAVGDEAAPLVARSGPIRQRVRGDALDLDSLPAIALQQSQAGTEPFIAVRPEASQDGASGTRRMQVRVERAPLGYVTVGHAIGWRGGTGDWQGKVTVGCAADEIGSWLAPARWMSARPRSDGALAIDVRVAEGAFD